MDSIQAEEHLLNNLKALTDPDGVAIGLIIGQVSGQKGFVVHLAPTPEQSKQACLGNIKDFDEKGLGDHARYVTRMLPGGLSIVGVFIISNKEVFTSAGIPIIRKIIQTVDRKLTDEFCPYKRDSGSLVVLHFNGAKNEIAVKRFDLDSLKNVNWTFKNTTSTWCEINTDYFVSEHYLEPKSQDCISENLKNVLKNIVETFEYVEFSLENEKFDPKSRIESVIDKSKLEHPLNGELFRLFRKNKPREVVIAESPEQLLLAGCIPSKIFMHPRCTIEETAYAVKQDILRSLSARLEMHWETCVDEANGSPEEHERVHEPPRRVLIRPSGWKIMFADYVFPGEGHIEIIKSCKDLLDVDVVSQDILDTFERSADPYKMMKTSLDDFEEKSSSKQLMVLGGAAVVLIGLCIHYIFA